MSFLELGPPGEAPGSSPSAIGFVGGHPRLPVGFTQPVCGLCAAEQTFFFQFDFPARQAWAGFGVAVFACTCCVHEDELIPEMLPALPDAAVTAEFLQRYQRNFRILVFPVDLPRQDAAQPSGIVLHRLSINSRKTDATIGKIGGTPRWAMEDESPAVIAGHRAVFLFQLYRSLRFPTVPGSRPQRTVSLAGAEVDSPDSFYELFIRNSIYFFGGSPAVGLVYVLTQV